jgi:hypothetical protein
MEQSLQVVQDFFEELHLYVQTCEEDDKWMEEQKSLLEQKQTDRRNHTQQSIKERMESTRTQRLGVINTKNSERTMLTNQISNKKEALSLSMNKNHTICEEIQSWKEKIQNPDYFRHEKEYAGYGDFFPEITSLEDFSNLDFNHIVEVINTKKTNTLLAKVRLKLGDDNILMEYASFCNLLSKARYLCNIENEALEKKALGEIQLLSDQLEEVQKAYQILTAQMEVEEQQDQEDAKRQLDNLEQENLREQTDLKNAIVEKKRTTRDHFNQILSENFSPARLKEIYSSLERNRLETEQMMLSDGLPFQVHASNLWITATNLLKNSKIKEIVKQQYGFMLSENNILLLPGIFV